ncbi:MAG: hypothetical protein ACOYKE_05455 [Ferruginibacter sp.]
MSDFYKLDDYIKKQLEDYAPDLPADAWNNIQKARERNKPRRFWWWSTNSLMILGFSLISIATATFFLMNKSNTSNPPSISSNKINSSTNTASIEENNTTHNTLTQAAQTTSTSNSTTKTNQATTTALQQNSLSNSKNANATTSLYSNAKTISTTNNVPLKDKNDVTLKLSSRRNTISKKQLNIQQDNGTIDDVSNAASSSNNPKTASNETAQKVTLPINFLSVQSNKMNTGLTPGTLKLNLPGCPSLEKDAAGNKKYFEWYASIDYATKKYADTPNSVYLQKRKESTRFLSAYSAGFRFTRVFENGVSFRTGLNFSQINEQFRFVKNNWIQVNYTIDPNTGDTTGSTTVTGTRYKTTYNRYKTIDVPLLLGYELGFGKFHANFNAGAIINAYSWQRGDVLDTSYRPVSITTGKGSSLYQYKTNLGVGFTGAVSLYYRINNNLQILAEPYIRYNFSPMSKELLTLREKFSTLGLRVGLRYDLW